MFFYCCDKNSKAQEYKKYQENTISPVEQAYMETIKDAGQEVKSGLRKI
jgi:hypothetical protein